jgi:molecular chaperone GrpE
MSKKQHHHEPRPEKETEFIGPHDEEQLQEVETSAPEEQKPDYYDQFVRLTAEFENFRKRTEREKAAFIGFGKKQLAEK